MEFSDFEEHYKRKLGGFIATLGEPVIPSSDEVKRVWEERVKILPERSLLYVNNIKDQKTPYWYNSKLLGYEPEELQNWDDFKHLIHPSQQRILWYIYTSIFQILQEFKHELSSMNFYYTVLRSMKDKWGRTWLGYQNSEVFQFDKDYNIVSYITQFQIISEYSGEPLVVKFHKRSDSLKETSEVAESMNKEIKSRLKSDELLKHLGYTRYEQDILFHIKMASFPGDKELAKYFRVTVKAIEGVSTRIIKKTNDLFPLDSGSVKKRFKSKNDIVLFFIKMNII
ncbi:MAG: hypothetical protein AAFR87_30660 [Bacteroidota bacterium]